MPFESKPSFEADPDIDDRLRRLLEATPRGLCLTQREIAEAVGCSRAYIWQTETSALRKMRRVLDRAGMREALL